MALLGSASLMAVWVGSQPDAPFPPSLHVVGPAVVTARENRVTMNLTSRGQFPANSSQGVEAREGADHWASDLCLTLKQPHEVGILSLY